MFEDRPRLRSDSCCRACLVRQDVCIAKSLRCFSNVARFRSFAVFADFVPEIGATACQGRPNFRWPTEPGWRIATASAALSSTVPNRGPERCRGLLAQEHQRPKIVVLSARTLVFATRSQYDLRQQGGYPWTMRFPLSSRLSLLRPSSSMSYFMSQAGRGSGGILTLMISGKAAVGSSPKACLGPGNGD